MNQNIIASLENEMLRVENEMREWLFECFDDEYSQEEISNLDFSDLKRSVNRYYDGGFHAFLEAMN